MSDLFLKIGVSFLVLLMLGSTVSATTSLDTTSGRRITALAIQKSLGGGIDCIVPSSAAALVTRDQASQRGLTDNEMYDLYGAYSDLGQFGVSGADDYSYRIDSLVSRIRSAESRIERLEDGAGLGAESMVLVEGVDESETLYNVIGKLSELEWRVSVLLRAGEDASPYAGGAEDELQDLAEIQRVINEIVPVAESKPRAEVGLKSMGPAGMSRKDLIGTLRPKIEEKVTDAPTAFAINQVNREFEIRFKICI